MSDWKEIQKQYPLIQNKVYLKNASIGAIHSDVLNEITRWNESIAFEGAINEERFAELVFSSRDAAASFLNAPAEQVTLTENTSHNMNLIALMFKETNPEGIEIIAPADEFPSSILPFYHHGHKIIQVNSENGVITADDLLNKITPKTKAVVCSHIQFSSGHRMDIKKLSTELEKRGIEFILNATQSIGVFPVDLTDIKVTAASATCHKWLGASMGRCLFYLDKEFIKKHKAPLLGWCSVEDPFQMRNIPLPAREDLGAYQLGTLPFAQLAAVKKAIEVNLKIGKGNISERVLDLSSVLRKEIESLGLETLGSGKREDSSGTVTFMPPRDPDELVNFLQEKKIYVNNRRGLIRASIHFYNSLEDVTQLKAALKEFI